MKCIRFFLLLSLFASCRSARVFEAKPLPATFEGDSLFFNAFEEPQLFYKDVSDMQLLGVTLKRMVSKPFRIIYW